MKAIKLLTTLLLLLHITFTNASTLTVEQVQKFISISGLASAIDSMPSQFRQQFNLQALVREDKISTEKASKAMEEALAQTNGYQIAESYLLSRSDAASLVNAITFLESNLGRTIVAAEALANEPEFQLEFQSYALEMSKNPPSDERAQLIRELNASLNSEDVIVEMVKTMMFVAVDFFKEFDPEVSESMESELEAEWQKVEPMLRGQMSQYIVLASHYVYKNLTNKQMNQYMDFLNSKDGQIYWEASMGIFQVYINDLVKNMLTSIVEEVKSS